ncbi:sigma-70 family RNA polymerase sigma factor [Pilimelia columellifera]|uniref:sigma-70 family RNA polymerase sigma factor n=1 Tax=Pilimelia columellifera TaxID=706574 RepID=UPI0031D7A772
MNDEELKALCDLPDPEVRAVRAHELVGGHQAAVVELSRIRREALEELVTQGQTQPQLGKLLGVTRARVGQILNSGPRSERAFFASGAGAALTVAFGAKREADKQIPAPVVAQEDFHAYEHLAALARSFGLETRYEVIHPPGFVDLNRDNLVVICGPRLSPLIAQLLASDPNIVFQKDAQGWYLTDRGTGQEFRSPMDHNQCGDFAYLGRLPRLDGKGTFLYIAGIHAVGAAGVIHFLTENLPEVYKENRNKRFSTVIRCVYDAATREITESRRVAPYYRTDG